MSSNPNQRNGILPEPPLPYRLTIPALEHHATALGYLCMECAGLELSIVIFVEYFLGCSPEARRIIVEAAGNSIVSKCTLVLKLGRVALPNEQTFLLLEGQLKRVVDDIAPKRNRLFHDPWFAGEPRQWDQRPFLRAPQQGAPKEITQALSPERSLESVWELVRLTQEVRVRLGFLASLFLMWKATGQLLDIPQLLFPDDMQKAPNAPPDAGAKT